MIHRTLEQYIRRKRCTILGIGPMSRNCVDTVIELATEHAIPILLVASRRQIEAEELGGGYVNNWSTERFSQYVIDRDQRGNVILARDHGGPWQNTTEVERRLSFRHAMDSAKRSFEIDIQSGFEILHIDPSVDIFKEATTEEVLERVFELYEFCWSVAQRNNRNICFEIGTEEQHGAVQDLEQLEYVLSQMEKFCQKNHLPKPLFAVAQTGTKVMEVRNIGSFDSPFRVERELPAEIQIPRIIELCDKYDIFLKEHNADYMSDETLKWHPKLGIHAVNVAPELGVKETRAFVGIMREHSLGHLADEFLKIAYESGRWKKWMLPDSKTSDEEKGFIAGHYVYSDRRSINIAKKAQQELQKKGIDMNAVLKDAIRQNILRYLKNFNLLGRNK